MIHTIKIMLTGGLAITALAFSTASFSACLSNDDPDDPNDGYDSEIVTEYGGSTLSCPTNHTGCTIDDVTDEGYCIIPEFGETNALLIEIDLAPGPDPLPGAIVWNESEVTTDADDEIIYMGGAYFSGTTIPGLSFNDPATGTVYYYVAKFESGLPALDQNGDYIRARGNTDATIGDTATGANGCFNSFGTDQFTAVSGFERDNQPGTVFNTKAISFCSDGTKEFTAEEPEPPPKQARCLIPGTGVIFKKYGVEVTCPDVPNGEQRTIVVSKDTETCIPTPEVPCETDFVTVDGYGFFNEEKKIDFNNVCVCVGGDPTTQIHEIACIADPSYEGPNKCTVEEGANVPVSVTYQNPFCISGISTGWCW